MVELRGPRRGNNTTGLKSSEYYLLDRSPERHILDFQGQEGFNAVRLLGRYRYATAKHALVAHSHGPMLEICYLASGRQTYDVNGQEFSLVGGDIFMTFPGERHGTGDHPLTRGVLYWLLISVAEARESFLNLPRPEGRQLLRRLLQVPSRVFRGGNTLQPTLRAIFEIHPDIRNPLRVVNLRSLLLRFLLDVVTSAYESQPVTHSVKIQAMIDHVEANLEWPLVLSELARHVGMSLPRLKSKFKQEVGIPPADFIMRRRVEHAAQLLYETKDTVLDIAMRLGFCSSQYFATVFKRYTLHSPHEARAQRLKL